MPAASATVHHQPRRSRDDLMAYTYRELEAMYRAAPAPTSVAAADGKLAGRMLAWTGLAHANPLAVALRGLAHSPRFVWQGKTFDHRTGGGYNRVDLGGVLGRQHIFPFTARIEPSLFDRKPTIAIDYDRPANPPWMRRVHDEIRELEPGLFLGLDLWKTRTRSVGLVWFALQRTRE